MRRVVPSQVVALLDKVFPWMERDQITHRHGPALAALLELLDWVPDELLPVKEEDFAKYVVAVTAIRDRLNKWNLGQQTNFPLPAISEYAMGPLPLLRDLLSRCADECPVHGSPDLRFISDDELRENIRLDIAGVNTNLANGEWKDATVLSGSVIEALLLWKLQEHPQRTLSMKATLAEKGTLKKSLSDDPEDWHLYECIEIASRLELIKDETAKQLRLAKDFRNLIHPGRSRRLGQKCDRGTAFAAVAGLEFIIRDFTP
jgi:hypothetical protein